MTASISSSSIRRTRNEDPSVYDRACEARAESSVLRLTALPISTRKLSDRGLRRRMRLRGGDRSDRGAAEVGHVRWTLSHVSMQWEWNAWRQEGRRRSSSERSEAREGQTEQSSDAIGLFAVDEERREEGEGADEGRRRFLRSRSDGWDRIESGERGEANWGRSRAGESLGGGGGRWR
ncbi:uncharacterized protein A4U43_C10F3140 [Asparagus officinalis]|uniref:Uncharacterized protein n=1 Tax=Asparagus officinalis TaxID=4686 RepID=A0A5P1E218_ASPOF|nr:uncharacterized protein A4U43_C10F3140 [Asparagus officinalis]